MHMQGCTMRLLFLLVAFASLACASRSRGEERVQDNEAITPPARGLLEQTSSTHHHQSMTLSSSDVDAEFDQDRLLQSDYPSIAPRFRDLQSETPSGARFLERQLQSSTPSGSGLSLPSRPRQPVTRKLYGPGGEGDVPELPSDYPSLTPRHLQQSSQPSFVEPADLNSLLNARYLKQQESDEEKERQLQEELPSDYPSLTPVAWPTPEDEEGGEDGTEFPSDTPSTAPSPNLRAR